MPLENKAGWARLRVGVMSITALVILGFLVYLLTGTQPLFKRRSEVSVFIDDSADTAAGAPVRLNGILIGQVKSVGLSGSDQPGRIVKITMVVDDAYLKQIPVDSLAQIAQPNLLGTRYINIRKGHSQQTIQPGGELQNGSTAELQDLFNQGNTTLAALQETIKKVDNIVDTVQSGRGSIGKLLVDETLYNKVLAITTEADKLMATLNSDRGVGKFINDDRLYDDVRGTIGRVNNLVDGIEQGQGTVGQLMKNPALFDDARAAIADLRKSNDEIRKLLAGVNAGEGTVGKLVKSDELAKQLQGTIDRIDVLLDKLNSGQGTLGQLLVNPSLYESLDGTTRELQGLLKDFRANPKKFLHIKLGLF